MRDRIARSLEGHLRVAEALPGACGPDLEEAAHEVVACLRSGWTEKEIGEILLHVYVYAGVYPALSAFGIAREAIAEFRAETSKPRRAGKR